ncbi:predicted protein [Histoplasma capsulatum H143]|uniref:Uncharacterized protein n=1 Tax=Ajellomyces capsulatus (strain H143) TaxID=544712 RepID=C6H1J3_AJECH|nr:predicted protein [Histoplasma capsulatum H143]
MTGEVGCWFSVLSSRIWTMQRVVYASRAAMHQGAALTACILALRPCKYLTRQAADKTGDGRRVGPRWFGHNKVRLGKPELCCGWAGWDLLAIAGLVGTKTFPAKKFVEELWILRGLGAKG